MRYALYAPRRSGGIVRATMSWYASPTVPAPRPARLKNTKYAAPMAALLPPKRIIDATKSPMKRSRVALPMMYAGFLCLRLRRKYATNACGICQPIPRSIDPRPMSAFESKMVSRYLGRMVAGSRSAEPAMKMTPLATPSTKLRLAYRDA